MRWLAGIIGRISLPVLSWIVVGVAAFIGALLAGLYVQSWRLDRAQIALGECRGSIQSLSDTASNNAANLAQCARRLTDAIEDMRIAEDARQKADAKLERETEARRDLAERERAIRQQLYDSQSCEGWADQPVCPDVVDSLRRAARGDED